LRRFVRRVRRRWRRTRPLVGQRRYEDVLLVVLLHLKLHQPPCAPSSGLEYLCCDQCLHKRKHGVLRWEASARVLAIERLKLMQGPLGGRPELPLAVQALPEAVDHIVERAPAPEVENVTMLDSPGVVSKNVIQPRRTFASGAPLWDAQVVMGEVLLRQEPPLRRRRGVHPSSLCDLPVVRTTALPEESALILASRPQARAGRRPPPRRPPPRRPGVRVSVRDPALAATHRLHRAALGEPGGDRGGEGPPDPGGAGTAARLALTFV